MQNSVVKKIMYANNKHGEKPYLYKPANVDGETEYVIKHIEKLRIENEPLSQIAILERNSMSSFQIENELNRHCIPYRKLGGLKFMEYVCILDMLALMRALTMIRMNSLFTASWICSHVSDPFTQTISFQL